MSYKHTLKCSARYFDEIEAGEKNFEVRRNDRGFQKGDILILQKYDQERGRYVERHFQDPVLGVMTSEPVKLERRITFILTGGQLGIEPGYVVMALERTE